MTTPTPTRQEKLKAWAVHAFTLSGLVWLTFALFALLDGNLRMMWLWLGIAMIVDGVDGSMARAYRVREIIPWFNGTVVDHVVDYLTWTAVPALFIALHLPVGPKPLGMLFVVIILVSSCFCYGNDLAKSTDHYFVGFPAAWNVVAVLLWVWHAPMLVCIAAVLIFSVLTLVPLHYTHPFRVVKHRSRNIVLTFVWVITTGVLVYLTPDSAPTTITDPEVITLIVVNIAAGAWLLLPGFLRTLHEHRKNAKQAA
ncbi:phosphatidylcholine synthase [Corynebacterium uropygiale]|uniref:Phosphatidylcholine synthase n=1 Tax=Corynebacterium uropygiale TaxID=1775911 RepID=A0A9X1QQA1_9CORY|nr:phosphatidylcholine synthase [Corynebacterium uropygiale]MCF4006811.1 phosphatidylcholine synthase [Corynebacterium uropygiale]